MPGLFDDLDLEWEAKIQEKLNDSDLEIQAWGREDQAMLREWRLKEAEIRAEIFSRRHDAQASQSESVIVPFLVAVFRYFVWFIVTSPVWGVPLLLILIFLRS